jgi:hypothetical protein
MPERTAPARMSVRCPRLENAPVVLKTKTPLASGLEFELRDENYIVGKLTTLATRGARSAPSKRAAINRYYTVKNPAAQSQRRRPKTRLPRALEPLSRMSRCVAHTDSGAHAPIPNTSRPRLSASMNFVADVPPMVLHSHLTGTRAARWQQ